MRQVLLAKVDADSHKELAEKYGVSGYPTIKIFKKGKDEEYDGPREAKGIVKFVKDALGLTGGAGSVTKLKSVDEAKALQAGYALVGLFREPVSASSMCAARARAPGRPSGLRSTRRRARLLLSPRASCLGAAGSPYSRRSPRSSPSPRGIRRCRRRTARRTPRTRLRRRSA